MTSVAREIPLVAEPQRVRISLDGVGYVLTIKWCVPAACWVMDIAGEDNEPIAQGLPLVTGLGLLAQFEYLGISGELLVQSDNDADAVPTFDNLGTLGHLYHVTP